MAGPDAASPPPAWVPGRLASALAWRRQWLGRYDARTEAWFLQAWQRRGTAVALLDYLQFRRERGRLPTPEQAAALRGQLTALDDALLTRAVEVLLEADALPEAALAGLAPRLLGRAGQSPPLAAGLAAAGLEPPPEVRRLAAWQAEQAALREAFATWLRGSQGDIAVVGNAAASVGAGLGERIDSHAVVVRFNRYRSEAAGATDLGRRLDVWVCAPKFLPEAVTLQHGAAQWLVLSGPDVRYRRAGAPLDWPAVQQLIGTGVRVLTVPLAVWGALVDRLGAPPSAGVLLLAWVRASLGRWQRLAIAGFDSAQAGRGAYHHAGQRLRPGRRHDWDAERALLAEWRAEGLRVLRAGS